jgi:predicted ester cyclase
MEEMSVTKITTIALLTLAFGTSLAAQPASQSPAAWIERCVEHANQNRLDDYFACWAPDATNNGRSMKKEMIKSIMEDIRRTFPDYHSQVIETVVQGDTIVTMSRVSGTHRGVARTDANGGLLRGARPTGKHFEVLQTHWWKVRDGKIVFHRGVRDDLSMMRQLGLVSDELPIALREK